MAEVIITEDAIIINRALGIVRKTRKPEEIPDLYQQVLERLPDLDLTFEEFQYFLDQAGSAAIG